MNARRASLGCLLAVLALGAAAAGCKDKESLVIVTLATAAGDDAPTSATVSVGGHAKTFTLKSGIPESGLSLGVYVPAGVTGPQTVMVVATPASGGGCLVGSTEITINAAGDTVGPTGLYVYPSTTGCTLTGGSTGTGGSIGTGGSTGTGGISGCFEYDHGDSGQCAMGSSACTQDSAVYGAVFSPKSSGLAVTSGTDGRIKVWNVSGNGTMAPEGHVLTTTAPGYGVVAFSPDGSRLAVGMDGGVEILNTNGWATVSTFTVASRVYGVAFSPDGTQVITLDTDSTTKASHLYAHALATVSLLQTVSLTGGFALAVSPVASATGVPVAVTTSSGTALVYTLTAAGFGAPTTLTVTSDASTAETAQFSPTGNLLAAGGNDATVRFWQAPFTGSEQAPEINVNSVTKNISDWVDVVAFSPDGSELAVGGGEWGTVTTYATASRAHTGAEQDTSNKFDVTALGYSPDGKLIIGGEGDCGCVFLCKH